MLDKMIDPMLAAETCNNCNCEEMGDLGARTDLARMGVLLKQRGKDAEGEAPGCGEDAYKDHSDID